jgi:RNA polymerase sigma-70 factor (ECF subfamily)
MRPFGRAKPAGADGQPFGRAKPAGADGQRPERLLDVERLHEHVGRLYRGAYGLCRSREDAEDLVQETYARVLRRPRYVRQDEDIYYLMRVLRNTWIERRRAESRLPRGEDEQAVLQIADPQSDAGFESVESNAVYQAIRQLPDALRETIVLVDVVGLSYKETADQLEVPIGTVMSRLHRARSSAADLLVSAGLYDPPEKKIVERTE